MRDLEDVLEAALSDAGIGFEDLVKPTPENNNHENQDLPQLQKMSDHSNAVSASPEVSRCSPIGESSTPTIRSLNVVRNDVRNHQPLQTTHRILYQQPQTQTHHRTIVTSTGRRFRVIGPSQTNNLNRRVPVLRAPVNHQTPSPIIMQNSPNLLRRVPNQPSRFIRHIVQQPSPTQIIQPINGALHNSSLQQRPMIRQQLPPQRRPIVQQPPRRSITQPLPQQTKTVKRQIDWSKEQTHEDVEEDEKLIQVDTFIEYAPLKLRSGLSHPDKVVETASLSSVSAPEIRYHMSIPEEIIDSGKISGLQLEAALYACQAHEKKLPSDERVGYLIGDGPGVGKGRTIATVIYENYLLGRRRAIWVSVSADLYYDAQRDLRDIGAEIDVYALNQMKYAKINGPENGFIKKGVIFSTYSSLIGEMRVKDPNVTNSDRISSRLEQLIQWCGEDFDGLIVFDECHHAKNLMPSAGGKSTKTGKCVLKLQNALPNARVIYASATGATNPSDMGYMVRLGLWGVGQTFTDFPSFANAVENKGTGCIELIAIDMKLRGLYLARQLSFAGVDFNVQEVLLSNDFIKMYDDSVRLWIKVKRQFQYAIEHTRNDENSQRRTWAFFWNAHQRFFKYLCIGAKVNACVALTRQALDEGKCVVIGLQSTGESQVKHILNDVGDVTDFVSTTKAVLQMLIEKHFPIGDSTGCDLFEDLNRTSNFSYGGNSSYKNGRKRRLSNHHIGIPLKRQNRRNSNGSLEENENQSDEDENRNSETNSDDQDDVDEVSNASSTEDESDFEDDDLDSEPEDSISTLNAKKPKDEFYEQLMGELDDDILDHEVDPFHHDFSSAVDPWAHLQSQHDELLTEEQRRELEEQKRKRREQRRKVRRQERREKRRKERKLNAMREFEEQVKQQRKHGLNISTAADFMDSTRSIESDLEMGYTPSLMTIKTELLTDVERLGKNLPPNTLDQLIDELGGPECVAEMTGRKGRIVMAQNGQAEYQLRNADSEAAVDQMNMEEKDKFMRGEKLIAVISEAASSGISLQSDRRVENQRRRVHITLELPWSADRAVQQFGRTHRSNQVNAPEYLFLISELSGEKRFASAVAKRLECLGALTHGDRRAAESRDLSQFNLDNKYGRDALTELIKTLADPSLQPLISAPEDYVLGANQFFADMREYLIGVGVLGVSKVNPKKYIIEKDGTSLPKFLNRLLGLPVHAQNSLFSYFTNIINELIKRAKINGTFDKGIMDLGSGTDQAKKMENRTFRGFLDNPNYVVEIHKIQAERGVKWEEARTMFKPHENDLNCGFYLSKPVPERKQTVVLVVNSGKSSARNLCTVRPNTGRSFKTMTFLEINDKFTKIPIEQAETEWKNQYEAFGNDCLHKFISGACKKEEAKEFCEFGRRTRTYFVMTGSVIAVWPLLEKDLLEAKQRISHIQIVRIRTDDQQKLVGLLLMPSHVRIVLAKLNELTKTTSS